MIELDYFIIKSGFDIDRLKNDLQIVNNLNEYINPKNIKEKTFSISKETYGWEALPLHTLDGKCDNSSAIPIDIKPNHTFLPNYILKKCKYIQEIIRELNTEIYLVRIMKLSKNGYIAPHIDKFINNTNVIRCQLPIITDKQVDFVMNKNIYNLEAGNLYFINVGEKIHWVKNNSNFDRYTLVIDMKPTKEILSTLTR